MNAGPSVVKLFCAECGQKLSLPTSDLRVRYRCPRCQTVREAGALVPKRTTVPAVSMAEFGGYEVALAAEVVPEAVIIASAPPTIPMPAVASGIVAPPARAPGPIPAVHVPSAPHAGGGTLVMAARPAPVLPQPEVPLRLSFPQAPPVAGLQAPAAVPAPARDHVPAAVAAGIIRDSSEDLRAKALQGAAAVGRAGSLVLNLASYIDRKLDGLRVGIVGGTSILVLVSPWVDQVMGTSFVSGGCLILFAVVLTILLFARIDSFRDDTGWHLRLVLRTLEEVFDSFVEWLRRLTAPSVHPGQRAIEVAKPLFIVGLFVGASANALSWINVAGASDALQTLQILGVGELALAAVLWFWGRKRLSNTAQGNGAGTSGVVAAPLGHAVNDLPEVLDCRDPEQLRAAAARCSNIIVSELLPVLADWNVKRPKYDDEREYQEKLFAKLQATMPQRYPRREKTIGESERPDLLLGDKTTGVVIEMKHHLKTGALRNLHAQARAYAKAFQGRGPVLLILCRTSPEIRLQLAEDVSDLRKQGFGVLAILAAPGP